MPTIFDGIHKIVSFIIPDVIQSAFLPGQTPGVCERAPDSDFYFKFFGNKYISCFCAYLIQYEADSNGLIINS